MTQSAKTINRRLPLVLLFFTVFIDLIGFGIILPLLPLYAEHFGANGLQVGLLLMSYSLMQFLFLPFWGRLSDRLGRRPILIISLCASAVGYLIWGFATCLELVFLSRIVAGFGNANLAVAQAYIADVSEPHKRAKAMGLIGAAFGLGFVFGPAVGALCVNYGYQLAGFVACGISLVDLLLTYLYLPEPHKRSQAGHERFRLDIGFYQRVFSDHRLTVSFALFFISTFAFANMETTLVLLTVHQFHFQAADNGWLFAFIGLVMVFTQGGLIGRLAKHFTEKHLLIVGSAMVALGLALTPITSYIFVLYLALALTAVGSGLATPCNQSILSKLAPEQEVGGVMGIGQSLSTLGRIIGPIVGGATFQYLGMASPYMIGAAAMIMTILLAMRLPVRYEKHLVPETETAVPLEVQKIRH